MRQAGTLPTVEMTYGSQLVGGVPSGAMVRYASRKPVHCNWLDEGVRHPVEVTLTVVACRCIVDGMITDGRTRGLDPQRVDAVLFDLDGTLMDTDDQAVESLSLLLQRFGGPWLHRRARGMVMVMETPANALMAALDALGLDVAVLRVWKRLRRLRSPGWEPDFRLMRGARSMLEDLSQKYRLAIVTTRGREDAEAFLEQHDLNEVFDLLVTREDTWRLKPHPAPIERAAAKLGVPPNRCVMVGDTTVDVRSARRAGAQAVAVMCGFGERRELERARPDELLDHVRELSSLL